MRFQIDDDGAVIAPALERPVVDPNDTQIMAWRNRLLSQNSQQRIAADADLEVLEDSMGHLGSDRHTHNIKQFGQLIGAPGKRTQPA